MFTHAVSTLVYLYGDKTPGPYHSPGLIANCANDDEAYGKAWRAALKRYPIEEGWHGHSVSVMAIPEGR